jgi:hypothetical protein
MDRQNHLVVIATAANKNIVIFPKPRRQFIPIFHELSEEISSELISSFKLEMDFRTSNTTNGKTQFNKKGFAMSSALSTALCIINKQQKQSQLQPRILMLQFDKDGDVNYNSIMNSIFSAQKLSILIDSFIVSKFDSHILQVSLIEKTFS